jgi:hypothetical protein
VSGIGNPAYERRGTMAICALLDRLNDAAFVAAVSPVEPELCITATMNGRLMSATCLDGKCEGCGYAPKCDKGIGSLGEELGECTVFVSPY